MLIFYVEIYIIIVELKKFLPIIYVLIYINISTIFEINSFHLCIIMLKNC